MDLAAVHGPKEGEEFGLGFQGLSTDINANKSQPWLCQHVKARLRPWLGSGWNCRFFPCICGHDFNVLHASVSAASVSVCSKLVRLLGKNHKLTRCSVAL